MNHSDSIESVYDNLKLKHVTSVNNGDQSDDVGEMSALAHFAHATRFMTHGVVSLGASSIQPLPFTDYSLFDDKYNLDELRIHRNLVGDQQLQPPQRRTFWPNMPVRCVSVTAERKEKIYFIHPYK
jgi:hypothetical protein